ncbi:hypothetical protein KP509_32G066600 [Ceratopteris richardii]|uniref:RING-type domain-containing protein n=1 Tax=Ceratopteris richardii TaxID=49495 RepID=A0A8T2QW22_CERRI|nr:hypothetical protein KP509_32G066600 [Ceratopteris richardii]
MQMDGATEQAMRCTLRTLLSIVMMIVIVGATITSTVHRKASSHIIEIWVGVVIVVLLVVAIAKSYGKPDHGWHLQPGPEQAAISIRVDRTEVDEEQISRQLQPPLPKVAFSDACSRARYADVGTQCGICLEEFDLDDEVHVLTPCDHAFHVHCIRRWIALTMSCPMCRGRVLIQRTDNSLPQSEAMPSHQPSC